ASGKKILVLGMLLHISRNEGATRHHLASLRADKLKRALHKTRADALAAQRLRHLGMRERKNAALAPLVIDKCDNALHGKLETLARGIVLNLICHSSLPFRICLLTGKQTQSAIVSIYPSCGHGNA